MMNRKNMNYYNERERGRGGGGEGGGGEDGRGGGGGGGSRYNTLDYTSYPTAPRNYPLKYTPAALYNTTTTTSTTTTTPAYHHHHHHHPPSTTNTTTARHAHNGYPTNYGSALRQPPPYEERNIDPLQGRPRYNRSAEEYHHAYRGGYRPSGVDTDGYTTDGSGSLGYRDTGSGGGGGGGGGGFENFKYPESEALLPAKYFQGGTYPREAV